MVQALDRETKVCYDIQAASMEVEIIHMEYLWEIEFYRMESDIRMKNKRLEYIKERD